MLKQNVHIQLLPIGRLVVTKTESDVRIRLHLDLTALTCTHAIKQSWLGTRCPLMSEGE